MVIPLPILDDPVLSCTLPQYGQEVIQSFVVTGFWIVGVFAYFALFALFVTRAEKFEKPERADVRNSELILTNKQSVELFTPPEEDLVYGGIRKSNQVFTCSWGRNNPLQAIIVCIIGYLAFVILFTALANQVSVQVSRDIAVSTVNDIAFKSQVDENIICADARFKSIFD